MKSEGSRVGVAGAVRPEKRLLREILRFGRVLKKMQDIAVDAIAVSLEERAHPVSQPERTVRKEIVSRDLAGLAR